MKFKVLVRIVKYSNMADRSDGRDVVMFGRNDNANPSSGWKNPRQVMQSELSNDEELLWADNPISTVSHGKAAIPIALFGIPFFGFSVFWTWSAAGSLRHGSGFGLDGFTFIFPMFGIPFLLVGLGMLLSPVWKMIKAKHITYGVTNKRLIIREGYPVVRVKSWPISGIENLSRSGPANGPGDIYFAEIENTNSKGRRTFRKIGFVGISEPKRLEDKIRQQMSW